MGGDRTVRLKTGKGEEGAGLCGVPGCVKWRREEWEGRGGGGRGNSIDWCEAKSSEAGKNKEEDWSLSEARSVAGKYRYE